MIQKHFFPCIHASKSFLKKKKSSSFCSQGSSFSNLKKTYVLFNVQYSMEYHKGGTDGGWHWRRHSFVFWRRRQSNDLWQRPPWHEIKGSKQELPVELMKVFTPLRSNTVTWLLQTFQSSLIIPNIQSEKPPTKLHHLYQGILNSYFISDCNYFDDSWVLLFSEFIASDTFASIHSRVKEIKK